MSRAVSNLARVAHHARNVGPDETVRLIKKVEIARTILGKLGDEDETASPMKPPAALAGVRCMGVGPSAVGSGRDERATRAYDERAMRSRRDRSGVSRVNVRAVRTQAGEWGMDATLALPRDVARRGMSHCAIDSVC